MKRQSKMENKVLITGADGQLGSEVVLYCKSIGVETVSLTRRDADITNKAEVDKFILNSEPTHIIHCAAWTAVDMCEQAPEKAMRINSEGTKNIVSAAKDVGAHVTYISTDYVFDGKKDSPYTEDDLVNPMSIYGMTKLMGERAMRKTDAIVRVSWVCGEKGSNIVKTVLRFASDMPEFSFVGDQFGTPTFADDAAKRIVDLSLNKASGIWHVSNSGVTTWHEFVEKILHFANKEYVKVKKITTEELTPRRPARRPQYSALETIKEQEKMDHWTVPLERLVKKLQQNDALDTAHS
jgi:dTDP-4-dehydrorhamnose reductase